MEAVLKRGIEKMKIYKGEQAFTGKTYYRCEVSKPDGSINSLFEWRRFKSLERILEFAHECGFEEM